MGKPWLKLWTEVIHDRKLSRVSPTWRWAWIGILAIAAESDSNGRLEFSATVPYSDQDIEETLAISGHDWQQAKQYFIDLDMVTLDGGTLVVCKYAERQAPSDPTGAERMKRYRSKGYLPDKSPEAIYSTHKEIIDRDHGACVYCGATGKLEVDHMVPLTRGGTGSPDNLAAACRNCNAAKNNRLPEESKLTFASPNAKARYERYMASGTVTLRERYASHDPSLSRVDIDIEADNISGPTVLDLDRLNAGTKVPEGVRRAYETGIGLIASPILEGEIIKLIREHGESAVSEAFAYTADHAKQPSMAYAKKVLSSWKAEGKGPSSNGNKPKAAAAIPLPPLPEEEYHL